MIPIELADYIKKARAKKLSEEKIKNMLVEYGWALSDIEEALQKDDELTPPSPNQSKVLPIHKNNTMWDTFEHILLFISLYVMAGAIALILHFFVDKWSPGISTNIYGYFPSSSDWDLTMFRGYLASLIVSMPLFIYFFLQIAKRTAQNPNLRELKSRKILIYITLTGTFIIMLFNIISIVYNFLGGNVSLNFLLNFIISISVSGIIFVYYSLQVKEDRKLHA